MSATSRWMKVLVVTALTATVLAASVFAAVPGSSVTLALPYNSKPGNITKFDQVDYYNFSGTAGDEIVVSLQIHSIGSELGALLSFYDSTGNLIAYNDGDIVLPDGVWGDPILYLKLPSTGDYYISVGTAVFRTGINIGEPTGHYRVTLETGALLNLAGDRFEPNDTMQTASPISLPFRSDSADLLYFGDIDWFRFTAKKGPQYAIDIDALEMKSTPGWAMVVKPRLGVFDNAGHLLSSTDSGVDPDSGFVGDPAILFSAPQDGTYYIAITAPGDTDFQGVFSNSSFLVDPYVSSPRNMFGYYQLEVYEVQKILFPQLANGSFDEFYFTTSILLLNPSQQPAVGSVSFHNWDGSPMPVSTGSGEPVSTYWFNLPSKGSLVLKTDGNGPGTSGYAIVTSNLPVGGSAIFSEYDSGGVLVTEAGVRASQTMEFFAFPVDTTGDLNAGFAICNPNDRSVILTFKLLDGSGHQVTSRSLSLGSGQQLAQFVAGVGQLFPTVTAVRGSLQVLADGPVAAVALRSSSNTLTTLDPIPLNQTFDPVSLAFPQIVAGSSANYYRSTIILMNTGYLTVNGTIQFTRSDGTPMPVTINSGKSSVYSFSAPPVSTIFVEASVSGAIESGYALLTANHSLGGMAIISQFDGSTGLLQCEIGVTPAGSYSHFYLFAQTDGNYNTGIAVANPQSSSATVNFDLRLTSDLSQVLHNGPLTLDAGAQRAQLVSGSDQLFPLFTGFGTLEVTSAIPIPAMALRLSPRTMTALPVVPEKK